MGPTRTAPHRRRRGVAYVLALLMLAVFSALAVTFVTVGDANLAISTNLAASTQARLAAESGTEFLVY
ncbi:MAG: hypothetical protein ACYS5V_09510, partial [Planctomycetota bacterium]